MEELCELLVPVLRDLVGSEAGHPSLVSAAEGHGRRWLEPNVRLLVGYDRGEVLRQATEVVQDYVIEELWGRDNNWPPCPHHPDTHPLDPVIRDDGVWWTCPRGSGPVCEVGRLAEKQGR